MTRDPKPTTTRSEEYKAWLREKKCVACLANPPSHAHHLKSGVMGGKKSDLTCIPLCPDCHRYYHDHGHSALEEKEHVDLWKEAHRLLRRYVSTHTKLV